MSNNLQEKTNTGRSSNLIFAMQIEHDFGCSIRPSETRIISPWKGEAIYFNIVIDGANNKDAAWHYPEPKEEAKNIKGYITFSRVKGIVVEEESAS